MHELPLKIEKKLERTIEAEIASEATGKLKKVLVTGKFVQGTIRPHSRLYGFESTTDFVSAMFDFWDLWHDKVEQLQTEAMEYKWDINELLKIMAPEVRDAEERKTLMEFTMQTMIAGQLSGNACMLAQIYLP